MEIKDLMKFVKNSKIHMKSCDKVLVRKFNEFTGLLLNLLNSSDLDSIKILLEAGINLDMIDESDRSEFFHYLKNPKILRLFINAGMNVNLRDASGDTLLTRYVSENNYKNVKMLIENGADVNITDDTGDTALHSAGRYDIIKLLINAGADVNATNNYWLTPLLSILEKSHRPARELAKLSDLLIQNGAKVNTRNHKKRTPLHYAHDPEVLKVLIHHGADINAVDIEGRTALNDVTSTLSKLKTSDPKYIDKLTQMALLLLENGANINIRNTVDNKSAKDYIAKTNGKIRKPFEKYLN